MTVPASTSLAPDALDENRAGRLTDTQRRNLRSDARAWRKNELVGALVFGVVGVLLLISAGPAKDATVRLLVGLGAIVVGIVLLVRGLVDADPLVADLRDGRVERVEGAIARRTMSAGGGRGGPSTTYILEVAGRSFHVAERTYHAAPDAGIVALYDMPRSHHVVNLEQLPDRPLRRGALDQPIAELTDIAHALRSHDRIERAEAAATLAVLGNAVKAEVQAPGTPPPGDERDPRPLAEAILGSWTALGNTVTFGADGSVTMTLAGRPRQSRWSVGADGRLHVDLSGRDEASDAWVAGNTLTLSVGGTAITWHRAAG